jgi:hypothetical protein
MRESRLYGSVWGACDETHVPTATAARIKPNDARREDKLFRKLKEICCKFSGAPLLTARAWVSF